MSGYTMAGTLEECKRYCRKGYVVYQTKRVCNGWEISFRFRKPTMRFHKSRWCLQIFGTYINWSKTYDDKPFKLVYDPEGL